MLPANPLCCIAAVIWSKLWMTSLTLALMRKHSFEDVIIPMIEAKKRWGERIALFGGLDVDFLCNASVEKIKERTKNHP